MFERDGFTFDIGPSLLTLPQVFDDVFQLAGTSLDEQLDLVRLDPQFRYFWRDGARLVVHDDNDATAAAFETFAGAGAAWRDLNERRSADLGGVRADVLRRSDVEPARSAVADGVSERSANDRRHALAQRRRAGVV